jgi:hypothetical protein
MVFDMTNHEMEQKWKQKPPTNDMEENCKCTPVINPLHTSELATTINPLHSSVLTTVSNPSDHKEVTVVINPLHSYLAPK